MNAPTTLILASGSSIRRQILQSVGLEFEVRTADVDERAIERDFDHSSAESSPAKLAQELAVAKAQAVAAVSPDALVIGCDQILVHDGAVLHKADNRAAARTKLLTLQARQHRLLSAAALVRDGAILWQGHDMAILSMRALSRADIDAYLDVCGDASTQSVGAYRLEERGAALFDRIEGDYFTILGLPLLALLAALRVQGIDPLTQSRAPSS